MQFSLLINTSPSSSSTRTALSFAIAVLKKKHTIYKVFFYRDGVLNGTNNHVCPQSEIDTPLNWQKFLSDNNIDNTVCIAAAIRRGILNDEECKRYNKSAANLAKEMELSGLGQLVEASVVSDRLITFK